LIAALLLYIWPWQEFIGSVQEPNQASEVGQFPLGAIQFDHWGPQGVFPETISSFELKSNKRMFY